MLLEIFRRKTGVRKINSNLSCGFCGPIIRNYEEGHSNANLVLRGFAKKKNPRLLWKWVGGSRSHSEFFFF